MIKFIKRNLKGFLFGAFIFLILPLTPAMLNNTDKIPTKHIFWFSGMRALEVSPVAMFSILVIGGCVGTVSNICLFGGKK